ncbi:5,5'-dehydrodivanillate O-demethylase oxygenase subunit [Cupriavidus yeoncheonensis]|uniref:5,5'-dehydrodivanillate O-demethylase oxygenase subunit n=1 Tax=Cupriavidus yeoncheonensis TaxID=1462994 RepID=A0A916MX33_9BURK|nr:aromatic ring-hydroxylating dioxygenase subunit alpha [Cupriavidus yeoncheonensis]CAG2137099.1 5,5'-dehydrodivanillate O-demethylase oxygenase subunit [Cupriavidus yeoncheonensis]
MDQQRNKAREDFAERMRQLSETSADTTMGKVLRQFWHPVALSRSVEPGKAREIRVLGEDLALYRGQSGRAYVMLNRCAHRLTKLHTGWVEGDELRCMYHGWKYDGAGQCTERPAERPGTERHIRVTAYPVHEYCGLVFIYMGEGEPPAFDLFRKPKFEEAGVIVNSRQEIWPCNWLQHSENSLDAVHVSFAHQMGRVGVFGEYVTADVPEVSYEETSAGIRQAAVRKLTSGKLQTRISDWTFPYCNHVSVPSVKEGQPWIESVNFMVPIDDTHTLRISLRASPSTTPEADRDLQRYFDECESYQSSDFHDELFAGIYPDDPLVRLTSAQDYVVLVGQGAIADRANEILGASDRGIAMLRQILNREMDAVRNGTPPKVWQRLENPSTLMSYATN